MRDRPHYLELPLPTHVDDPALASLRPPRRRWWLILSLVLLAVFLIGVGVTGGIR